ncbi:11182_t:CDS:1, partial [Gigaspora margarita]
YNVCSIWMKDSNSNFITYIPQGINGDNYIKFYCGGHMPQYGNSGVFRPNEVITLQTLDRTTIYTINYCTLQDTPYSYYIQVDFTDDVCLVFIGSDHNSCEIDQLDYNECKFLRDGPSSSKSDDQNANKDASNTFAIKSITVKSVHLKKIHLNQ